MMRRKSYSNSRFSSKHRHFGRDAENQAKDGNKTTNLLLVPKLLLSSLYTSRCVSKLNPEGVQAISRWLSASDTTGSHVI